METKAREVNKRQIKGIYGKEVLKKALALDHGKTYPFRHNDKKMEILRLRFNGWNDKFFVSLV